MGESSAMLSRSLSHPSPKSSESRENENVHGALTSSVSLGRFISETLAWDKWSVFNQNRYIEEAERYSKPGSVAEKKAYFEAHYKKLAAKKAAALAEQESPAVVNVPSVHKTYRNDDNSAAEMDPPQKSGKCAKVTGVNALAFVDASQDNLPQKRHVEGALTEEAEVAKGQPPYTEKNVKPPSNQQMDVAIVEGQLPSTEKNAEPLSSHQMDVDICDEQDVKALLENASTFEDSSSMDKSEDVLSFGKPSSNDSGSNSKSSVRPNARVSRRKLNHVENSVSKKRPDQSLEKKRSARERPSSTEKVMKPLSNHHRNVETRVDQCKKATVEIRGASVTPNKNVDARSSGKLSLNNHGLKSEAPIKPNIPTFPRKLDHTDNPISKKRQTQQSLEKKRPSVQALHMSMNITSPVSKKMVNSRLHEPIGVNGRGGKPKAAACQSKRNSTTVSQSFSLRSDERAAKRKEVMSEIETQCKPKAAASQSKRNSTTVSQSFSLRSDERAAKRKEFFEKLEQQKLSSEAEKELCISKQKEKAKGRTNVHHQSVPSLVEAKANFHSSTVSATVVTQKTDNNSRPPWRFSKKTDSIGDVAEKNLCKVTKNENTCPNIQLSTHKLAPKAALFARD